MAADELRRGVDNDVSAMLKGAEQVGSTEGVVDHNGQAVLLCDFGNCVDVGDVGVGVA